MNIAKEFSKLGVKKRQEIAAERRAKVKELKDKGLSGPQIAAELSVKLRTVYNDFSVLKRESKTAETEKTDG